jgi:acetyl esterase/lipase
LTFFPPEPALYQFERRVGERVLGESEPAPDRNTNNNSKKKKEATDDDEDDEDDEEDSIGEIEGVPKEQAIEIRETREKTNSTMKSGIEGIVQQAQERRKQSKIRASRDIRDQQCGVHFRLLLDPRLQVPPHDEHSIECVKIPAPRNVYIAAVVYRLPPERRNAHTKTLIMAHGNATDIGAMFPIQVILAHSLDINVVSFDYSGYGESGGVPDECATYRDMDAVYDYTVEQVAEGNEQNVILYGQSVGSGPCCYLAAQKDTDVGGMILHSPFTSGMRVLTPSRYVYGRRPTNNRMQSEMIFRFYSLDRS